MNRNSAPKDPDSKSIHAFHGSKDESGRLCLASGHCFHYDGECCFCGVKEEDLDEKEKEGPTLD